MNSIKDIKAVIRYSWLPILIGAFLSSFNPKFDLIGLSFALLTTQSIIALSFTFSRKVSLLTVFFIFTIVFLNLLPWLHYSTSHIIWRSTPILDLTYLKTNIAIFMANNLLLLTHITINTKNQKATLHREPRRTNTTLTKIALITLSGISFSIVFYLNEFSIPKLLFRGLVDDQRTATIASSSLALLLGLTSRLIPVFCFLYAITSIQRSLPTKAVLLALMLLSAFPTGVARYMVGFAYIPLALLLLPPLRHASIFSASFLLSIVFVFPFLNQFRHFSGFEDLSVLPSPDFFYAAHFDAYENFASAIESNFVSYGSQLLGSLLFFVPRTMWPDKPVGSGYELAENLAYSFNNISMPYLAEGFVNFGFVGIVVFAIAIGYAMGKFDARFATNSQTLTEISYPLAIYYFLIGALFFLLRGDLLSSLAYIIAGLTVAIFIKNTTNLIRRKYVRL